MVTLVLRDRSGSGKISSLLLSVIHRPAASDWHMSLLELQNIGPSPNLELESVF